MAKPKEFRTPKQINWHGLPAIGYDDYLRPQLTGDVFADQLAIEAWCFRMGMRKDEGGLGRFGHFKNIVNLLWNNEDRPSHKRFMWNSWADRMLLAACENQQLSVAGPTNAGKSDPFALWAYVNYFIDPTHVRVFIMSTTIDGAKMRIWARMLEYMSALPEVPGQYLKSSNRILGPNYEETEVGEASGIRILAGQAGDDKEAVDKFIGIKAPKTGNPAGSYEELRERDEFAHIVEGVDDEEYLRDLLPRLTNLSEDRYGKIIVVVDEATGISDAVRNAINGNMLPGNPGRCQVIMIGNPALWWDTFGLFSEPAAGCDAVTLNDEKWETKSGGLCLRFNAEKSPRIVDKDERLTWMLSAEQIENVARDSGGKTSPMYYRFVLGMWCPEAASSGAYSRAMFEQGGAFGKETWGFQKPKLHSSLDPSFTLSGDKASCTFFLYGVNQAGRRVMEWSENVAIEVDAATPQKDVPYQIAENWKKECLKRGVLQEDACFDTAGSPAFANIVYRVWGPKVHAVSASGKASDRPIGRERHPDGRKVTARERYSYKVTEIWFGAVPFLYSAQIKGLPIELAKELCLRRLDDKGGNTAGRLIKIESKREFRSREGHSPNDADSWLLGIEHLRERCGFIPLDEPEAVVPTTGMKVLQPTKEGGLLYVPMPGAAQSSWDAFKQRARRMGGGAPAFRKG
ncbi:MAG: hypothetical protein WC718_00120 [Phycisphaerales bacterium]